MTKAINTCRIWGMNFKAVGYSIPDPSKVEVSECSRSGGGYVILGGVGRHLDGLDDGAKARLTTWLVDQRLEGNNVPTVTAAIVEYAANRQPLPIYERADRLLNFLSSQTKVAGEFMHLLSYAGGPEDVPSDEYGHPIDIEKGIPTHPTLLAAMAWSESTSRGEIAYLAGYLQEEGWVYHSVLSSPGQPSYPTNDYRVTVSGHARVGAQAARTDYSQVFVAMWFDDSVVKAYDEGIALAIEECGYKPKRIDRDPTVDKIDDAIISEIRRSRFLVADFTHGEKGARGGVYYEAGFAYGLEKPVIYTCHADMVNDLHLDTRQHQHILWKTPQELREGLKDRILARIGEGPVRYTNSSP